MTTHELLYFPYNGGDIGAFNPDTLPNLSGWFNCVGGHFEGGGAGGSFTTTSEWGGYGFNSGTYVNKGVEFNPAAVIGAGRVSNQTAPASISASAYMTY